MLRSLFPEASVPPELTEACGALQAFRQGIRAEALRRGDYPRAWIHYDLWAKGLHDSLLELHQSLAGSRHYAADVRSAFEEEMEAAELEAYRQHLYFYKDGFIRIFALLDKCGHLLNEFFGLRTEALKYRYSYYTVLRRMQDLRWHSALLGKLLAVKEDYREAMQRLRRERNLEVHILSLETVNDMSDERHFTRSHSKVEPLEANLRDLASGTAMVQRTLSASMAYCLQHLSVSREDEGAARRREAGMSDIDEDA